MIQAAMQPSTPFVPANHNPPVFFQRAAIERAIEALIDLLDAADGDIDREQTFEGPRPVYAANQARGPLYSTEGRRRFL